MWLMHWVSKIAESGFPREGYPKGFNSEYLKAAVIANCAIMARELGEKINVSYMTILGKLKKNGKVSVFGKWVPHNLSLENHQQCFDYCKSLLTQYQMSFLDQFVTGDKKTKCRL